MAQSNFHRNFLDLNYEYGIQHEEAAKKLAKQKVNKLTTLLMEQVEVRQDEDFKEQLDQGIEVSLN